MKRVYNSFRRGLLDLRVWVMLLPALVVLALDLPVLTTLLYSLSAVLVIVAMTHVIRRIIFHYLDMELLALIAQHSATGAGLTFVGVCIVLASIIVSATIWVAK